jgi:hypothetical protein
LRETVRTYGNKTARQLVDLTHLEPTWTIPNKMRSPGGRAPVTYDLFFRGAPEKSQRVLAKVVAEQYGVAIPLAGDAEYAAFMNELASYGLAPDEISESDIRSRSRYSKA